MAVKKGAYKEWTSNSLLVLWRRAEQIEDFIDKKLKENKNK